jgi:hypothetical protein
LTESSRAKPAVRRGAGPALRTWCVHQTSPLAESPRVRAANGRIHLLPSCGQKTFDMRRAIISILICLALAPPGARGQGSASGSGRLAFFESKIRPILVEHCYRCHSVKAQAEKKLKAGLFVDSRMGLIKGGESGPAVVPGSPTEGSLLKALRYTDPDLRMPPKGKLPSAVVADFEKWIAMGAPDPREEKGKAAVIPDLEKARMEHWAFKPIPPISVPKVKNQAWVRTPIDTFILQRLEGRGITPSPAAEPATLLRRVYFDLIGLPPSPEEQQAFLESPTAQAYEKVVDDLLQRPQYGERWGRHWLDVARYAESLGFEHDEARAWSWRYRDWVIDAFNSDMPYDRFLTEQLAGDEVKDPDARSQFATSFLRLGTYESNAADLRNARYAHLDDIVSTVSMAFLGQTVQCARCHDHKFEPISQQDYYRLLAIFEPLDTVEREGNAPAYEVGSETERAAHLKRLGEWKSQLDKAYLPLDQLRLRVLERSRTELLADPKLKINDKELDAFLAVLRTTAEQRTKQQAELLLVANSRARSLDEAIKRLVAETELAEMTRCLDDVATCTKRQPQPTLAHVYREKGLPETWLFGRGETTRKVRLVLPGAPEVLGGDAFPEPAKKRFQETSGRRLWLAEWMTNQARPLVARVLVNRIWQQHFGRGMVEDANNLGLSGGAPSHPELLDWLAGDLVNGGWRIKRLHRQIVLSSAYRQGSRHPEKADADGKLFARWLPRHLEAEAVRDAMLAAGDKLNLKMGGSSDSGRRSVYVFAKRLSPMPMLDLLGAPDSSASTARRSVPTTAVQALLLLNSDLPNQQARAIAARVKREAGPDAESRVRLAYTLIFCRAPVAEEMRQAQDFLQRHPRAKTDAPLEQLCLVLLNASEFLYLN